MTTYLYSRTHFQTVVSTTDFVCPMLSMSLDCPFLINGAITNRQSRETGNIDDENQNKSTTQQVLPPRDGLYNVYSINLFQLGYRVVSVFSHANSARSLTEKSPEIHIVFVWYGPRSNPHVLHSRRPRLTITPPRPFCMV